MTSLTDGFPARVLALAIAALLFAVLYLVIAAPLVEFYRSNQELLEQRWEVIRQSESAVQDLPRLRAAAKKPKSQTDGGLLLLKGASDAVAAAELQSTLKNLVGEAGATLSSAQVLPSETQGGFRRIGVHVSFSGDISLLTTVVSGLETANPVLSIGNFEVHRAGKSDDDDETLAVAMDVYGFRAQ